MNTAGLHPVHLAMPERITHRHGIDEVHMAGGPIGKAASDPPGANSPTLMSLISAIIIYSARRELTLFFRDPRNKPE